MPAYGAYPGGSETYMGLVETGVGLLPAAAVTKSCTSSI
ncbi:hypothetical protein AB434_0004 [Heyndrickxia coagulans]|nr:hypothetical protein AB434_0004 [Heyndrickxia coagulans]